MIAAGCAWCGRSSGPLHGLHDARTVHVMPIDREQYLTPAEVGKALMVSADTIRRWARQGRVKAHQLPGGTWLIHRDVITAPPK